MLENKKCRKNPFVCTYELLLIAQTHVIVYILKGRDCKVKYVK